MCFEWVRGRFLSLIRFLAARGNAFVGLFTLVGRRDMLFANFRESRAGNLSICPFGSTTRLRSSLQITRSHRFSLSNGVEGT